MLTYKLLKLYVYNYCNWSCLAVARIQSIGAVRSVLESESESDNQSRVSILISDVQNIILNF